MRTSALLRAAAALALLAPAAAADVVELTNGVSLEGEVLQETGDSVTLRVEGGQVTFERKLVASIRREPKKEPAPAPATPASAAAGVAPAPEDWVILWAPDRRAGFLQWQARENASGSTFEAQAWLVDAEGKPAGGWRLVEESGPRLEPRSFLWMENGDGRDATRSGKVEEGRLVVETFVKGEKSSSSHPLPDGFRFSLAARAAVLRSRGAWEGTTFDPREGKFLALSLRVAGTEKASRDGREVEALVLVRDRGGVRGEERVGPDGRILVADVEWPALAAVGCTKERVEAFRAGTERETTEEEKRARTAYVSPEDGFRILKPGASWAFVPPESRAAALRVTVKDPSGGVQVAVEAEDLAGAEPPAAQLGAELVERIRKASAEFSVVEDGYGELAGRPGFRLVCDALTNGDRLRILAWALVHRGRTWTFRASAPRGNWNEALPYLKRILDGFEWL